jgi:hypothetical protein
MRQAPIFGRVVTDKESKLVAWSQCAGLDAQRDEIENQRQQQHDICQENLEYSRSKEEMASLNHEVNRNVGAAKGIYDLIQNPREYLLSITPRDPVINRLLKSRDNVRGMQALYTFAHDFAELGMSATPNPIIRSIQEASLEAIGEHHQKMLVTLDELVEKMRELQGGYTQVRHHIINEKGAPNRVFNSREAVDKALEQQRMRAAEEQQREIEEEEEYAEPRPQVDWNAIRRQQQMGSGIYVPSVQEQRRYMEQRRRTQEPQGGKTGGSGQQYNGDPCTTGIGYCEVPEARKR